MKMFKITKIFLFLSLLLFSFVLIAVCSTKFSKDIPTQFSPVQFTTTPTDEPLKLLVWNIGYAGLGEESDFFADGGEMRRPPSKEIVTKNLNGIKSTLDKLEFDVALMQEVAKPGLLTRGENVLEAISATLNDYGVFYSSDMNTKWLPGPISFKNGLAIFSKSMKASPKVTRINEEPGYILGFIKRKYHIQELEMPLGQTQLVIMNIHLSAFDESADVRRQQLSTVLNIADQHYQEGKAVIIGGDWNMRLTQTDFPYTSSEDALFWIHDFPENVLRPGWERVFDPEHPTVRTNERPFNKAENYTTIIDGLVVSPNIRVISAKTQNLDFQYTDHQPAVFELELVSHHIQ